MDLLKLSYRKCWSYARSESEFNLQNPGEHTVGSEGKFRFRKDLIVEEQRDFNPVCFEQ